MFVSNLPPTVTEEAIKERFGSIGLIKVSLQTNGFFQLILTMQLSLCKMSLVDLLQVDLAGVRVE